MAVYTQVSDDELSTFLLNYDVGQLKQKTQIAEGIENTNYRVDTEKGRFILTLFEKRIDEETLPFFMALTTHLSSQGLPVAAPIENSDGQSIARLAGRPAALIEFLDGRPHMAPGLADCSALGSMLALLHKNVVEIAGARPNPLSLSGWLKLADSCRKDADRFKVGLAAEIDAELEFLKANWPTALPRGIIHGDLFPDNVLFDGSRISGVIDFYFSCTDFFAYDLAVCINAWCFNADHTFSETNAQALMKSYQFEKSLSEEERTALPILLRGSSLRFLLTRLYDWSNQVEGALVTVKDPSEYCDILAFHRNHFIPSLYGL